MVMGLTRKRLPQKRGGNTYELTVGGQKVFLRTGEYEDGSLGEIFIDVQKEGATLRSIVGCFAISVSLGLQFGVPLAKYVERFKDIRFEPAGVVTGFDKLPRATSLVDLVFRVLGIEYLRRDDLARVAADDNSVGAL